MKILIMMVHRGGAGSNVLEVNAYYPYGMIMPALSLQNFTAPNYYRYSGKELQQELGLQLYDFGARMYNYSFGRWIAPDPLAEKYYNTSHYVFALNNPLRFVDPDGRDVWEINENGRIMNHYRDRTQDAFYMVDANKERIDGQSIHFDKGTISGFTKKTPFNSATSYSVTNERDGADLFKFFADYTKNTEFGLINTAEHGSTVMTNHLERKVYMDPFTDKMNAAGQTITSVVHNHPRNGDPSSDDRSAAGNLTTTLNYSVQEYVYRYKSLVPFNANTTGNPVPWSSVFTNTQYK